jgi:hypothetical protein
MSSLDSLTDPKSDDIGSTLSQGSSEEIVTSDRLALRSGGHPTDDDAKERP